MEERQKNFLNSPVRLDGTGEPEVVRDLLQNYPHMTARQALESQLALERIASGDLSQQDTPEERERIAKLRGQAEAMDRAARAYEEDPQKFMDDMMQQADKIRPTGDRKERIKAQAAQMYQQAQAHAVASRTTKKLQFVHELKFGPKEEIMVPGIWEIINGQSVLSPEVIRIMDRMWILPPGKHIVPKPVAEHYRQMRKIRAENDAREAILKTTDRNPDGMELGELQRRMREIDKRFGSVSKYTPIMPPEV